MLLSSYVTFVNQKQPLKKKGRGLEGEKGLGEVSWKGSSMVHEYFLRQGLEAGTTGAPPSSVADTCHVQSRNMCFNCVLG